MNSTCVWCGKSSSDKFCDPCRQLKTEILQDPAAVSEIYPGFQLQVTYEATTKNHDGYCSDHIYAPSEDEKVSEHITTQELFFPLPRFFIESDFDADGYLVSKVKRNLYKKQPEHQVIGWCEDCQTYYKIISAKLIRPTSTSLLSQDRSNWRLKK